MTAQHVAWLLLGVASGVASGYPWGRWNGKRALDRAWDDGWDWGREDGYADCLADAEDEGVMPLAAPESEGSSALVNVPRPGSTATSRGPDARGLGEPGELSYPAPGHLDWRERTALELAPETLAGDVPRARTGGRPVTPEQPGPGHPPEPGNHPSGLGHPGRPWDDLADELAAEAEAHLARHTETHDEWTARMDYEHALWCAETGLVNEWAAA